MSASQTPNVTPFRAAVEARDIEAAIDLLHPDVEFRSPVVFTPYRGKEMVGHILRAVAEVFEEFEYVSELQGPNQHGLVFKARASGKEVEGWDFLTVDDDGKITEFVVMVRPLSALMALAETMKKQLAGG